MESLHYEEQTNEISNKLLNQKQQLALQRFHEDETLYPKEKNNALRSWREELIDIFARSISEDQDAAYQKLKSWGKEAVNLLVNLNLPLDLAIEEIRFYRDKMGEIIKDEAVKYHFSLESFYEVISRFDSIVDRAIHWLSLSYSRSYSLRIHAAEATAVELSIPIIRVTEDIGVLPLIGDLDTRRAKELIDKALSQGSALGLSHFIIDLSGVPIIDTMVANQIFKVIDSLELIGIHSTLTGIRPEIAQTMVQLGINLSQKKIQTFSSLHQAIKKMQLLHKD